MATALNWLPNIRPLSTRSLKAAGADRRIDGAQSTRQSEVDELEVLDPAKFHERLDPDRVVADAGDQTDRQTRREHAAVTGGDDPVAHRQRGIAGDIEELGLARIVAGHDG